MADLKALQNTLKFFTDFNHYNYYGLDFLRFYSKKALKLVGYHSLDNKFYNLVDTVLSLKNQDGDNSNSISIIHQLSVELNKVDENKFDDNDLKKIIEEVFNKDFPGLSHQQQSLLCSSLLDLSESWGIDLDNKEGAQKIVDEYNQKYSTLNTLTLGKTAAIVFAAAVALSEGIASVYFMGVYNIQSLLFIGLPSFAVNYLLFYPDLEKLICSTEKNGNKDSHWLIKFGLPIASIAAGAMTAFVALNSMLETFGAIFFNLSPILALSAPPIGLISFVSFFAFSSFIANTALLMGGFSPNNISFFYKSRDENIFTRLCSNCVNIFKNIHSGNFAKASADFDRLFIDTLMLGAAIALSASIYMSSLGLFRSQAIKTLTGVFGLSSDLSSIISYVAVTCCGQLLNGLFYVDKILYPLNTFGEYLFSTQPEKNQNPDNPNTEEEVLINNITNAACAHNTLPALSTGCILGAVAYFSWINGNAQGEGFANDALSTSGVQWISFGALTAGSASFVSYFLGTVSSFIMNYNQASDYIQKDPSLEKKKKI